MKNSIYKAFVCLFAFVALTSCGGDKNGKSSDGPAPKPLQTFKKNGVEVKAYDYEGLKYFLTHDDGNTYVVNFWATWCIPCVEELPYFEQLGEKYKDDNVRVILVSLDMTKNVESKLLPFVKDKNLKSEVLWLDDKDSNKWIPAIDPNWSGAIPATLIYNGKTRRFYEQSFTFEELERELSTVR